MRKILVLLAVLAVSAFGRQAHLYVGDGTETPDLWDQSTGDAFIATDLEADGETRCDGDVTLGDAAGDTVTITGTLQCATAVSFPDGTALLPSITNTGDPNTGWWFSAADTLNASCGGIEQWELDATSLDIVPDTNVTGDVDIDGDTDLDDVTISGVTDVAVGAVGAPTRTWTGDLDTGQYWIGADSYGEAVGGANVGTWDATGLQGDLGQTTPGAADVTTLTTTDVFDAAVGAVGTPSRTWTGDLDTGQYWIGADSYGEAVGGANVGTWDATGLQGDLGQTTPGAADVTTLTTTDVFDAAVGAVGTPSRTWTGDLDTGEYWIGANSYGVAVGGANVLIYDGTGITVTGGNGPWGTVTPAQGEFTNVYASGDFYFGPDPDDMHTGYKERGDYVTFSDTFDVGNNADLAVRWDLTNTVGAGTNDEQTTDGWNLLTTGGAGGPDAEATYSNGLNHYRAYAPRIEIVVELGAVAAGQNFTFGFYNAANDFVEIIHEPATSANWLLRNDDTAGAETVDSTVPATTDPTKLEIQIDDDGTIHWAIDDVAMTEVGITNTMTANAMYVRWTLTDVAAAAHTAAVDYYLSEQLRQQ